MPRDGTATAAKKGKRILGRPHPKGTCDLPDGKLSQFGQP